MMRPDWIMLVAILSAGSIIIILFALFFAFVLLDEDETSDGWLPWDVDDLCNGCTDYPAFLRSACAACRSRVSR